MVWAAEAAAAAGEVAETAEAAEAAEAAEVAAAKNNAGCAEREPGAVAGKTQEDLAKEVRPAAVG